MYLDGLIILKTLQFDQQSASAREKDNITTATTSTSCQTQATESPYDVHNTSKLCDTNDITSSDLYAVLFQLDEEPSSPLIQPEQSSSYLYQ